MKNHIHTLLLAVVLTGTSEPITRPVKDEYPVYGPAGSLIGVVRRWHPCYFYPLHTSLHPYINKGDLKILNTPWQLDSLLHRKGYAWVRISDTSYINR